MMTYTIQDLANSKGVSQPVREALLRMESELTESRRINAELMNALQSASNYIDTLGGISKSYRALITKATGEQA